MHILIFLFCVLITWERTYCIDPCNCGLGSGVNVCCQQTPSQAPGSAAVPSACSCGCNLCSSLVVRPQPLPRINLDALNKPTGDLCTCTNTIVKPAIIPKPACASAIYSPAPCGGASYAAPSYAAPAYAPAAASYAAPASYVASGPYAASPSCGAPTPYAAPAPCAAPAAPVLAPCASYAGPPSAVRYPAAALASNVQVASTGYQLAAPAAGLPMANPAPSAGSSCAPAAIPGSPCALGGQPVVDVPACGLPVVSGNCPQYPYVPSDVISRDIAYNSVAQARKDKAERKLAYGFVKIPVDVPPVPARCKIQEGNFQAVNGKILEFKSPAEDLVEEEELVEEDDCDPAPIPLPPSLTDIGYGVASYSSGPFVNIQGSSPPRSCIDQPILPAVPAPDGYVPGQVIISNGPVNSEIPLPKPPPPSLCADNDAAAAGGYPYPGTVVSRANPAVNPAYYSSASYSAGYPSALPNLPNPGAPSLFLSKLACAA